jgi:hypothetical protein
MTDPARATGLWPGSLVLGNRLLVALGVLAPLAFFVAVRIGVIRSCTGLNLLGLPWHPAASTAGLVLAVLVMLGAFVMLIFGYGTRGMRGNALGVTLWWVLSLIPLVIVLFLSVYGDPAPGCVPV